MTPARLAAEAARAAEEARAAAAAVRDLQKKPVLEPTRRDEQPEPIEPPAPPAPGKGTLDSGYQRAFPTTNVGELLQESNAVNSVQTQRRSQISYNPRVRGFGTGQIYTQSDGAQYFPVRLDLDSLLNKFDPSLIDEIHVIPGPYGVRYGPGLGFIDLRTIKAPRYEQGYESHNRFGTTFRGNGSQLFMRDTVYGGGEDWGFIFNVGHRVGSDYEAGNGLDIPSSYTSQNYLGQLGFDLTHEWSMEVRYNFSGPGRIRVSGSVFRSARSADPRRQYWYRPCSGM